jgi:hypothetical protein
MRFAVAAAASCLVALGATTTARADGTAPHEFLDDAKQLMVVGACAPGDVPEARRKIVDAHCKVVRQAQDDYKSKWITPAREFFAAHVPATAPHTVVYPFAGGDLSTALTVYPDADEITTLSLEPAGDPRELSRVTDKQLASALKTVATELSSLYTANFSVTMNMITAMREGQLPTQLIFSLSALSIHGYELTSVHYFTLTADGDIQYVTDDDLARIEKIDDTTRRNRELANVEMHFHKTGSTHDQVYRHILANLDDAHVKSSPAALAHLAKKGHVAAMTKAASYLLTFDDFTKMRQYIEDHVDWMVSDTTGLAPSYGTPAGFEYETWGQFDTPNMAAGNSVAPQWRAMYAKQPKRDLKFRFGYPDHHLHDHLVIMRRAAKQ